MGNRTYRRFRMMWLVAATSVPCFLAAAPASAKPLPFSTSLSGTIQITAVGPNGPTAASYGGRGVATHLGAVSMEGSISIVGPADCPNGFTATHSDTLTASDGDQVVMAITETSCPRPTDPSTYDCTGTYTVTGGTGRFASAGGSGLWSGTVTFSASGSGTFNTTHSGDISQR